MSTNSEHKIIKTLLEQFFAMCLYILFLVNLSLRGFHSSISADFLEIFTPINGADLQAVSKLYDDVISLGAAQILWSNR